MDEIDILESQFVSFVTLLLIPYGIKVLRSTDFQIDSTINLKHHHLRIVYKKNNSPESGE